MSYIKLTEALEAWSHRLRYFNVDTHLQSQRRYTPVGYTSH